MKSTIFSVLLFVCSASVAQEISCPEGTFKGEDPIQNNVHTVFCQKWVQSGGVVSKPKKEILKHGPYLIYEKTDPALMKFQLLLKGDFADGKPVGIWKQLYDGGQVKAEFKVNEEIRAHGDYAMFYPDGKKKATGEYENGNPSSKNWKFMSRDGSVIAQGDFDTVKKAMDQADADERKLAEKESQSKKPQPAKTPEIPFGAPCAEWIEMSSQDGYYQQISSQAKANGGSVANDFPDLERKHRSAKAKFDVARRKFERQSNQKFSEKWCQ